jgi:hypothetical protein
MGAQHTSQSCTKTCSAGSALSASPPKSNSVDSPQNGHVIAVFISIPHPFMERNERTIGAGDFGVDGYNYRVPGFPESYAFGCRLKAKEQNRILIMNGRK